MILPLFKRPVGSALDKKRPVLFAGTGRFFMGQVISIG